MLFETAGETLKQELYFQFRFNLIKICFAVCQEILRSQRGKHGNKTGLAKISICRFEIQTDLLS